MAHEPRNDSMGVSPRPQPWPSHPNNGSELPTAANATAHATSVDGAHAFSAYENTLFLATVLVSLCGLVGNGTVIWLLGFRIKRNPFSVYILNLAGADFAFLFCKSVRFLLLVLNRSVAVLNVLIRGVTFSSYLGGLSLLMAVSVERCLSVLFPIWYRCRRLAQLSAIACALIWGLSLCMGILVFLCVHFVDFLCDVVNLVYNGMFFLTFLVLCASSLALLIWVQCFSMRRQPARLSRIVLLTVLAFLVLGLPLGAGLLADRLSPSLPCFDILLPILHLLSALNSGVNPLIYFFMGRQRQQRGQKPLREVLQSALTEDVELIREEPPSPDDT
ncbi:mas-related G-protein coupled receptor member E [Equus quagga]|uniref:mas-related G-protein coupled receptor member E n=2 Tax=Equus quagga TaxID=89248 RepID=UPI001EE28C58|nr:mas-related G-protein coupled receptor member E [Equus quagga]